MIGTAARAADLVSHSPPRMLGRIFRRPGSVVAVVVVLVLGLVAAGADLLASDKPIAMRWGGRLYLLPCLSNPPELLQFDNEYLRARLRPEAGDWLLEPPLPFGPTRTDLEQSSLPAAPGGAHPLGTDEVGRDVLARLIHGARVSLSVGLLSVALYLAIGIVLGAVAGYWGKAFDVLVSRSIEVMLSFPTFFLILAIVAVLERPSLGHLIAVIGLTRWPAIARLVRGEVLRIRELEYVQAARALGASDARIIVRHVLPNALGPAIVAATLGISSVVVIESSLSFLGVGAPPPAASWGEMLTQAHRYALSPGAWWLAVYPGAAIFATVAAFNAIGAALRDGGDPRAERAPGRK